MAYVRIPAVLRKCTNEKELIQISGKTIKEVIFHLLENYPLLKQYLLNDSGQLSPFVNIYLNSRDIRSILHSEEKLIVTDELTIIPALAGG